MTKFINWKRNWLSSKLELFVNGIQRGVIVFSIWRSDAESTFEDKNYFFKNIGFWQSKTNVIDRKTNEVVAIITYDNWKSKAIINMCTGEQYEWKSTGLWQSKFVISNYKGTDISYSASSNSGSISSDSDNNLLILAGLFIKQIYNKRSAAFVGCFMPIIITITSRHH